jgi:hypothetical protein
MAGSDDIITKARLQAARKAAAEMMDGAVDGIRDGIVRDMTVSAKYAADGRMKGAVALLNGPRPDLVGGVPAAFATVPRDAVQAVISRSYKGKVFSDRIWDLRKFSQNAVQDTVAKGILQGKSAYEMSKELEAFLLMSQDEAKAFARVWAEKHTDEWKAAWKTRGRLKYNTRRLARTEINNAYREGAVQSAKRAPWVKGVKWNLSGSHVKPDICDEWGSADNGMGPGVYAPGDAPIDHANGLCFLTDELVSDEELAQISREQVGVAEEEVVEVAERTAEDVRKEIVGQYEQSSIKIDRLNGLADVESGKSVDALFDAGNEALAEIHEKKALDYWAQAKKLEESRTTGIKKLVRVSDDGFDMDVKFLGDPSEGFTAAVKNEIRDFTRIIDESILSDARWGKNVGVRQIEGRASATTNWISVSESRRSGTVAHEMGHWLEGSSDEVRQKAIAFYKKRTVKDTREQLADLIPNAGYHRGEVTKKDAFLDYYMGKTYGPEGAENATELVSMGMEYLQHNPYELAKNDGEMFDFIYNLVRGQ